MDERANRWPPGAWRQWGSGVAAAILLMAATRYGEGCWWDPAVFGLLTLGLILIGAWLYAGPSPLGDPDAAAGPPSAAWPMTGFLLALLLLYAGSSAIGDHWFFPTHWKAAPGSRLLGFRFVRSLVLTLALAVGFKPLLRSHRALIVAWVAMAGLAVYLLYQATGFAMIYRVDSPAFVYRFWSFLHTFPRPGFYDPHWNAGMPVPYLVASGVWSVGLWLLPFLHWIPAEQLYTPFLAVTFLGIVPLLAWASLAWTGASRRACWIAALLALAPGQRYWVHLLHYGTAPALFSMTMAMPLSALAYRFLYLEDRPRPATLLLLLLCGFTLLAWPGAVVIALPLLLVLVCHAHRLSARKWIWTLGALVLLVVLLLPLAQVPMRYSNIGTFVETTHTQTLREHFRDGWILMGHNLRSTHPWILIFGMLGGCFAARRSARRFFAPLILLLVILSGWGEEVMELLQTERLIIPAALVAIVPAAEWLDHLIQRALSIQTRHRLAGAALRTGVAWALALLLVAGYEGAKAWGGKGLAPFHTMPDHTRELVQWLSDHVPEDGRVLFAGHCVHAYGGAKVAALPLFTGREMMAADFYGFSPKLVEHQYPPRAFRYDGPDVLFAFMELYNVTHVVTWHDDWKAVFHRTTAYYRPVHVIGRVAIFETRRESSLFLQGAGRVEATFNRIELTLDSPQDTVIIKYNWTPGWQADGDAAIFPHAAGRGVTLIGVHPGANLHVTLRCRL